MHIEDFLLIRNLNSIKEFDYVSQNVFHIELTDMNKLKLFISLCGILGYHTKIIKQFNDKQTVYMRIQRSE